MFLITSLIQTMFATLNATSVSVEGWLPFYPLFLKYNGPDDKMSRLVSTSYNSLCVSVFFKNMYIELRHKGLRDLNGL